MNEAPNPAATSMRLDYSFNDIATLFQPGDFPFPDMRTEKVKVSISGSSDSRFPPIFAIGDLLCHWRPTNEIGITLLLRYQAGITPPSNEPPSCDEWTPVSNSPIYGQIRVSLTPEAIKQIRKPPGDGDGYDYELTLQDVQFTDKTRNA